MMKKVQIFQKFQPIAKIISKIITILFFMMFLWMLITPVYNQIWLSSSDFFFAQNVLKFQSIMALTLSTVCIASFFLHKVWLKMIWIAAFYIIVNAYNILPEMQRVSEIEKCIDSNYCQEEDRDWATYEECIKNKKAWNKNEKACDLSFDIENCKTRFSGNWELPEVCNH